MAKHITAIPTNVTLFPQPQPYWGALKMTDMKAWNWRTNLQGIKLQGVKLQDMKMTDQVAGHEIARHENAGRENAGHEIAGQKLQC